MSSQQTITPNKETCYTL